MLNLLIVDKMAWMAHMMATALADEPNLRIVGVTSDPREALAQAIWCDVIAISAELPEDAAPDLVEEISRNYPSVKVMVMDLEQDSATAARHIRAGARELVYVDDSLDDLLAKAQGTLAGLALILPATIASTT